MMSGLHEALCRCYLLAFSQGGVGGRRTVGFWAFGFFVFWVWGSLRPMDTVDTKYLHDSKYLTLRVQVPNNHILTQNLYYNYYYPKPKYPNIGYMDP